MPASTQGTLAELDKRIAAARQAIMANPPVKSAKNPHFKNSYCPLDELLKAIIPALDSQQLCLSNGYEALEQGLFYVTEISFQGVGRRSAFPVVNMDAQKAGGAGTYGARYNLQALLAIATEDDDDGTTASGGNGRRSKGKGAEVASPPAASAESTFNW